jgi:signal transduction histidine kinase
MIESIERQPHIEILPAFNIDRRLLLKETDLNGIAKMVGDLLPQRLNVNVEVTVTLLEKNLMTMADVVLMKEALKYLIKNAMNVMPNGGKLSLSTSKVNFEIESLLHRDNYMLGACAFISLADTGADIDERIKEKMFEPFFIPITSNFKGLDLLIAYRITKQHHGYIKIKNQGGQETELNIYLPLTVQEIMKMVSIPVGASHGR